MVVPGIRAWLAIVLACYALLVTTRADVCHATSVYVGDTVSCALLTDKSVRCWGDNNTRASISTVSDPNGQPLDFGGGKRSVLQLAVHGLYSCALLIDQSVACWGDNNVGQFGTNDAQNVRLQPTRMQLGTGGAAVQQISTGCCSGHSCAVVEGLGITCWGQASNLRGTAWLDKSRDLITEGAMPPGWVDLGIASSNFPTVLDICTGQAQTCILTEQLGLQCWGVATHGELGLGNITNTTGFTVSQLKPVNLGKGRKAVQVSCGSFHTCAVLNDGTLKCWGSNDQGQLGYNDTLSRGGSDQDMGDNLPPVYLGAGRTVKQAAAGSTHTCAILDNGDLKCWGDNTFGQLGEFDCSSGRQTWGDQGNQMGDKLPAITLGFNVTATSVAGGYNGHTCASLDNGSIKCWGSNAFGELGLSRAISSTCLPTDAVDLGSTCTSNLVVVNNATGENGSASFSPEPAHTPSTPLPSQPSSSPVSAPSASAPSPSSHSVSIGTIVGPVVAVVIAVALAALGAWWWRTRKGSTSHHTEAGSASTKQPSAQVVVVATDEAALEDHSLIHSTAGGRQVSGVYTPPTGSTGSDKADAKAGSSSQAHNAGVPYAAIMSEGTFEDMRIPWAHIKIGKVLGEGGFGTVYKAKWRAEIVAVKLLNVRKTPKSAIHNLYQEALIMSRLRHPCIARMYGVVDEQQHHALVMQYYPNGALAKYMLTEKYAALDLPTKFHIARQIASGMLFMHERPVPILHGDLKAANILLTGPGRQVAIADFGLSQAMLAGQEAAVASGALTYSISPPEVLNNPLAPRTPAADVYAFAIVLLEIYTGKRAFGNLWPQDIRMMVAAGGRPQIPADMPTRISALIQACWAQDAAARPSFAWVTEQLTAVYEDLQLAHITDGTKTMDVTHTMTDW